MPLSYQPKSESRFQVLLQGEDSDDFLQRLSTVPMRSLKTGQGKKGCFLNSLGRFEAFFTLWKMSPTEFLLEGESGKNQEWKKRLIGWIEKYHFAERLTFKEIDEETHWFFFESESETSAFSEELKNLAPMTLQTTGALKLKNHGSKDYGKSWFSISGEASALSQWKASTPIAFQEVQEEELEKWRINQLTPRTGSEITPETNPLEVNLTEDFSEAKGCYPGQEVIEKIFSKGAPSKRLALLEGYGKPPLPGTPFLNPESGKEAGKITSSIATPPFFQSLALLKKTELKEGNLLQSPDQLKVKLTKVAPYESQR
jgi:folate-binding protein YgfZ